MPKVVDSNLRDLSLIERAVKPFVGPGAVDESSEWRCKDEPDVVPLGSCGELIFDLAPAVLRG